MMLRSVTQESSEPMKRSLVVALLFVALLFASACSSTPPAWSLSQQLNGLAKALPGDVGIYVRHLETGEEVCIAADTLFPTASMVKVPILGALFDKIENGELSYHQKLTYTLDRLYAGEDLLGSFQADQQVALDKVAMLMITTSDNTASLWCQELAGTGSAINHWLDQNGFEMTRVNSRTDGRRDNWKQYGWGQTTPREMAELLVAIRERQLISEAASEEMQRCLSRIYWDREALSAIPPKVQTMSKQGAVSDSRSEVVLVHAPHGDYVFCVITKNQEDKSWDRDNQGYVLLREVSALLWRHFEPSSPYVRPAGAERYQ
ncbi:MAG: beta-lactamase class A [Hyphomicrobiaceae bacterium]|jgi:beta-lactamase class A